MSTSIVNNMMALNAQRQFGIVGLNKSKSTEKLSSGYKINRAADDAAGLAISEKMRRQIRGLTQASANCQDGVSLCQVADGALNESQDILQRMNELAVKSANGTNSDKDREYIQQEVGQLKEELDRIANNTTFNEGIYPLRGGTTEYLYDKPIVKKMVSMQDVSFDDVKLIGGHVSDNIAETYVGWTPFKNVGDFDSLDLEAIIDDPKGLYSQDSYNLIFGEGSTSHSKIRAIDVNQILIGSINYPDDYELACTDIDMASFSYVEGSYKFDEENSSWSRKFAWSDSGKGIGIELTQSVKISDDNKSYIISNAVKSVGTKNVTFDFMMNIDTAYDDNDECEAYYIDGEEVKNTCIYDNGETTDTFYDLLNHSSSYVYDSSKYPGSLSIANEDLEGSLPFTEKLTFDSTAIAGKPVISIGNYYGSSSFWDYYKKDDSDTDLGTSTKRLDKTVSLIWSMGHTITSLSNANQHVESVFSFKYGVDNIKTDNNLPTTRNVKYKELEVVDTELSGLPTLKKYPDQLYIQAGSEAEQHIDISLVDATISNLGVSNVDVSTAEGAQSAIDDIKGAIKKVSEFRSDFGAQQNRLEHTIKNLDNVIENTTDAESHIRDTDMATEMVQLSNLNVLQQVGQSILSQANQSKQGLLSLLQ